MTELSDIVVHDNQQVCSGSEVLRSRPFQVNGHGAVIPHGTVVTCGRCLKVGVIPDKGMEGEFIPSRTGPGAPDPGREDRDLGWMLLGVPRAEGPWL